MIVNNDFEKKNLKLTAILTFKDEVGSDIHKNTGAYHPLLKRR